MNRKAHHSNFNDANINPCIEEGLLSQKCIEHNYMDPTACDKYYKNYSLCRKFWANVARKRKTAGITPVLPTLEERKKIIEKRNNNEFVFQAD